MIGVHGDDNQARHQNRDGCARSCSRLSERRKTERSREERSGGERD